ncbi:MAG: epoxyqueuosine reductase QueH [Christensenellales bacterium]
MNGREADRLTETALSECGSVLLHCCCGPCATSVTERVLKSAKPTLYYYNPNIWPEAEYFRRLEQLNKVAAHFKTDLLTEDYRPEEFLRVVKGLENEPEGGGRCAACFKLRLYKTAEKAKELGFGAFASTLTVSPHKDAALINELGLQIESATGVKWIPADFKKRNGYLRSLALSQELKLYRQNYCGCAFSARGD